MKTKLHNLLMLLLFYSFIPNALATNYKTILTVATLTVNSEAINANWIANPIDNAVDILNINAGKKSIRNNTATGSSFTVMGFLEGNGAIKTMIPISGCNFFNANGNVLGTADFRDSLISGGFYMEIPCFLTS